MNTSKIIRGVVSSGRYTVTAPIVKEDYGLYLKIEGVELPSAYEVDFSNSENNGTGVTMIGNADGVLIPRQFIDSGKDVLHFCTMLERILEELSTNSASPTKSDLTGQTNSLHPKSSQRLTKQSAHSIRQ